MSSRFAVLNGLKSAFFEENPLHLRAAETHEVLLDCIEQSVDVAVRARLIDAAESTKVLAVDSRKMQLASTVAGVVSLFFTWGQQEIIMEYCREHGSSRLIVMHAILKYIPKHPLKLQASTRCLDEIVRYILASGASSSLSNYCRCHEEERPFLSHSLRRFAIRSRTP